MSVETPTVRADDRELEERELEKRVAELEALIEEARRRARRRRQAYGAFVLVALVALAASVYVDGGGDDVALEPSTAGAAPTPLAQQGSGGWQPTNGPDGGWIFAVAVDPLRPTTLYAGGWGSIFKSTDGARRWRDVSSNPWTRVTALAIDPGRPATVFAATERGIAKTANGGRTWRMINTGLFDGESSYRRGHRLGEGFIGGDGLAVDPSRPGVVYAATARGIYRTTNGGARWREIGPPTRCASPTDYCPAAFAIDPRDSTLYASWPTWQRNDPPNVFTSADGGRTWQNVDARLPRGTLSLTYIVADPLVRGTLYAIDGSGSRLGVLKSTDAGTTWNVVGLPDHRVTFLRADATRPGTLFAVTTSGALRSSDRGVTWQALPVDRGQIAYGSIVTDPSDPAVIYGAGDEGIVKTTDGGKTWRPASTGLVSTSISALAVAPSRPDLVYAGSSRGVHTSRDAARTWDSLPTLGHPVISLAVDPGRPRLVFAGTLGFGAFRSTDGGRAWTRVAGGLDAETVDALVIDPHDPNVALAGARGAGLYKSADSGETWLAAGLNGRIQSLAFDPKRPGVVFAGKPNGLYRSRDGGADWELVATAPGLPNPRESRVGRPGTFDSIAIDPDDPDLVYAAVRGDGVLKSSDGGDTWALSNEGLAEPGADWVAIDPSNPRSVYASVHFDGGLYRSTNAARTWQRFDKGMTPPHSVESLAIDPRDGTIHVGTGGGGVVSRRR